VIFWAEILLYRENHGCYPHLLSLVTLSILKSACADRSLKLQSINYPAFILTDAEATLIFRVKLFSGLELDY
jgi:hypothetical protein